jgi:hypothetical protein
MWYARAVTDEEHKRRESSTSTRQSDPQRYFIRYLLLITPHKK